MLVEEASREQFYLSPQQAARRGSLTINSVVFGCMFGLPALIGGAAGILGLSWNHAVGVAAAAFPFCWILAWLSWSILVPRWRVWAYERVDDLDELRWRANAANLIWPDGHFLERTEIRTAEQRRRIQTLEAAWQERKRSRI